LKLLHTVMWFVGQEFICSRRC